MTLHGQWLPESFTMAFWLELEVPAKTRRQGADHPMAAGFDDLQEQLPESLDLFDEDLVLLLPTVDDWPLPTDQPIPPETRLRAWSIPTGRSIADCVFEYLYEQPATGPATGTKWGASLHFWHLLATFAKQLHEGGRFAPGMATLENRYYPTWQGVFDEVAEERLRRLVQALPPYCRAVQSLERPGQNAADPVALCLSFLDAALDHLQRQRILRQQRQLLPRRRTEAPLYRQWFKTLKQGQVSHLEGTERETYAFANQVTAWVDFLRPSHQDTPWRLGLGLHAPEVEHGPWRLEYLLCSAKNAALRLPAEQIWESGEGSTVQRLLPNARELLLADLGAAGELFEPLRETLRDPRPTLVYLDREMAYAFISGAAGELRRRGFQVILPEWWEDEHASVKMRMGLTKRAGSAYDRRPLLGVNELVAFKWELSLGDHQLSAEEFAALASGKHPLVFHQGRWYRLDLKALNRSLSFLQRHGLEGEVSMARALKLESDLRQEAAGLEVEMRLQEFFDAADKLRQADSQITPVPAPPGFLGTLRPYQERGLSWLLFIKAMGFGACLADDMGLGKTVQLIALLVHERECLPPEEVVTEPSLIICPMSVVGNWVKEFSRFAPQLKIMVHHGSDRESAEVFANSARANHVVITTYNLVVRDLNSFLRLRWDKLILDEAQNIKNPATKQAASVRSLRAMHRFCLTGTPIENRLTELWSIINFLNPGYLGSLSAFRRNFSVPIEREQNRERAELLQQIIQPFVLRRHKSDREIIRDLPDKQENKVYCNLTAEQAALYQMVVNEMLERISRSRGVERKGLVLTALMKLKQVTNHPAHFLRDHKDFRSDRSGKLQRLEEMLETLLEAGERALIFSQFTEIGDAMRLHLAQRFKVEVLYMHGGTPKLKRDEMIQRFQRPDGPPVFLLSLKAGGIGLNLTNATHVFHFDRWWNPAIEDQATDRAFRIGQRRNVQVHKFISIGTVEERIDQMIEEKKNLADNIICNGENMLTELSTDELREVFALTHDAVVE